MDSDTDFLLLYKILGLKADCELDQFKLAYRRRVAVLHPDRRLDGSNLEVTAERLQQLMTLYAHAMAFQRQHGRLPGAIAASRSLTPGNSAYSKNPDAVATSTDQLQPDKAKGLSKRSRRWLLALACGAIIWLLWPREQAVIDPLADVVTYTADDSAAQDNAPSHISIALGMDADTIRALEGPPAKIVDSQRWEYGTSWIRFENNKVIDWYSSPQRPLDGPSHPVR